MTTKPDRVDLRSTDLVAAKRAVFDQHFPGVLVDGVLDAIRLGALLDTPVTAPADAQERFGLTWSGKQEAVRSLLAPSRGALVPEFDSSVDFDAASNVFIEGDNLEVLKLLQKGYDNKIKLIYIDPPYNTGNDFVYRDDFTDGLQGYLELSDQLDANGNLRSTTAEVGGRHHSRWLSMIYPRLLLARTLLAQDGFLFVSIDDHEVAALRLVLDEIFGPDNFVTSIMWKRKRETSNDSKNVSVQGEYILVYARSPQAQLRLEPLDQSYLDASYRAPTAAYPDGLWRPVPLAVSMGLTGGGYRYAVTTPGGAVHERVWAYPQHRYDELLASGRVYFGRGGVGVPQRVIYAHESAGKPTSNYWDATATNKAGKKVILEVFGGNVFETAKPPQLIQRILRLVPDDCVVLDFFAGSGTTAHAVALQNAEDGGSRRWILVDLPEPVPVRSAAASAGFETVADITRARLGWVLDNVAGADRGGLRHYRLTGSSFRDRASVDPRELVESTLGDGDRDLAQIGAEILLAEGVALDATWSRDQAADATVITADGVAVVLSLDLTDAVVADAMALASRVLVFLEDGFAGRDAVRANALARARNLGITLKTV